MNGGARLTAKVQLPVTTMHALLVSRKEALEAEIRERFRAARENHTTARVTMLSATLRAVKHQLAAVGDG